MHRFVFLLFLLHGFVAMAAEPAGVAGATADRLRFVVQSLCAMPRAYPDIKGLERCAVTLRDELTSYGWNVSVYTYDSPAGPVYNLYARCDDADVPLTIVGAHYDADPETPGADDNASAVAVLLETARLLTQDGKRPAPGTVLAFYTLEEPHLEIDGGSMGSWKHATALQRARTPVRRMLALEMVGYFSGAAGSQQYPPSVADAGYPDRGDFLALLGDDAARRWPLDPAGLSFSLLSAPIPAELIAFAFSDHYPFLVAGFPAAVLTDTAWLRNPHYHRPTDTPDTLDYAKMAELARALAALLRSPDVPDPQSNTHTPHP